MTEPAKEEPERHLGPGGPDPAGPGRQSVAAGGRKSADRALALGLAAGLTVEAAARQARVGARTAHRRLADPRFAAEVAALRDDMVDRAVGRMAGAMTAAADALVGLLQARSEAVRLGAARSLLELTPRLRETAELEQRLRDLEERPAPPEGQP